MGESLRASRTYAQEQYEVAQPCLLPASVPNPRASHHCHAQYGLSAKGGGRLTEAWPWLELEELWARRASGIAVAPAPPHRGHHTTSGWRCESTRPSRSRIGWSSELAKRTQHNKLKRFHFEVSCLLMYIWPPPHPQWTALENPGQS